MRLCMASPADVHDDHSSKDHDGMDQKRKTNTNLIQKGYKTQSQPYQRKYDRNESNEKDEKANHCPFILGHIHYFFAKVISLFTQ